MSVTVDLEGSAAIPRSNGEPVFDAPWQSRAFGMVVSLHESGLYPWDEFKARLIEEIDRSGIDETCDPALYYRQFTAAFTRLMVEKGLLDGEEIALRTLAEREALSHDESDPDHTHPHSH